MGRSQSKLHLSFTPYKNPLPDISAEFHSASAQITPSPGSSHPQKTCLSGSRDSKVLLHPEPESAFWLPLFILSFSSRASWNQYNPPFNSVSPNSSHIWLSSLRSSVSSVWMCCPYDYILNLWSTIRLSSFLYTLLFYIHYYTFLYTLLYSGDFFEGKWEGFVFISFKFHSVSLNLSPTLFSSLDLTYLLFLLPFWVILRFNNVCFLYSLQMAGEAAETNRSQAMGGKISFEG